MPMSKKILALFLCFFSLLFCVTKVSAHVLKIDGNIGATLHIDPDDDPIAGEQSGFFFEFKDKQNAFTPVGCDCTFSISESGKEIYSQPLFQNNSQPSLDNASVFFTFPQRDVYQVKVTGKPLVQNAFQPFVLTYDVRVAREATPTPPPTTSQNTSSIPYGMIFGGVVTVIAVSAIFIARKKGKV